MAVIMYRHLKEFIHWKDKFRVEIVNAVFVLILIVGCIDCVKCSESKLSSSKSRSVSGRTIFDHGLFRHDKPRDSASTFPVKSETDRLTDSSINDAATQRTRCQSAQGCQQPNIYLPSSDGDKRNRYTYERFKRSVTTLNFHPKPKNESKNVGVKPLRIFKYITEDDMMLKPSSETHHITIFQPIMNAASSKTKSGKSIKGDPSSLQIIDTNTSRQQVVAGTKVNLKAKLDKENETSGIVIKSNDGNGNKKIKSNDSDSKSKSQHSNKASFSSVPKPNQNILIFKPSLIIRKNNNKTSLIPSGNHATKYSNFNQGGGGGSIKPSSITAATNVATHSIEESTDPNSSTVNDRSLIHSNLYFDSVVTLSEEGQKQLLHQHHQTVEAHREKARKSSGNNENKYDDDSNKADEIKKSITPTPSSSFSLKSNLNSNSGINVDSTNKKQNNNHKEKKISPSLPVTNIKPNVNSKGSTEANTKQRSSSSGKATDLVKTLIHEINATIAGNNKDKVIVKVAKSKKSKNSKKSKKLQPKLDEDDNEQDGSERSRRSPFKVPIKFQQPSINNMYPRFSPLTQMLNNENQQQQLARAALFRRNPVVARVRKGPIITKKVYPRVLTPVSHLPMPGKFTLARTILPMRPMPMMSYVKQPPKQGMSTGTLGPGPVGPPIAAIKVANLNAINKGNNQNTNQNGAPNQLLNGKDNMADASRTVFSYKPLSTKDVLLNQAASSYYSPTYKRFKNRFHNQISSIMDSQRDLEDQIAQTWDESRYPNREGGSHSKHRSRNASVRQHRDRPRHHHQNERERHHERNERHRERDERPRERDERPRERDERPRERDERPRERDRPHHSSHRSGQHGHHPRHGPPRGKKLGPRYTYPKNAENIQDILKYFDKEAPPGMGPKNSFEKQGTTNPNRQQSVLPSSHPKLADLSGEFRDVHASLLKDIREFAKRPNLFKPDSHPSDKSHSHSFYSHENSGSPFEAIDELFGPKAKPVRDLVKPDLYSLENIRERIAFKKGKLHGKFTDKDKKKDHDQYYDHEEERHRDNSHPQPQADIEEIDGFYDSHRPSRHNSDDGQSVEVVKNTLFSKEDYDNPSSYNKRDKHNKANDDSHTIFPSSHFHDHEKETIPQNRNPFELQSAELTKEPPQHSPPTNNKSIILKRPNEPFRVREAEPKKKPEHDYFWNTFAANGFEKSPTMNYDTPLVLNSPPSPSVLRPYNPYNSFGHAAAPVNHAFAKPVSAEEEDIVEIHTGGPGSSSYPPTQDHNNFKQEKLKKLYMDVLQQKMQLEAALMQPPPGSGMMHHPSMHNMYSSASMIPQHNPLQVSRMAPASQGSNSHGTTSVTFHGNQGVNFPGVHGANFPGNPGANFPGNPGNNYPGNSRNNFPGNPGNNFPGNSGNNFPRSPGGNFPANQNAAFSQFQGMTSVSRRKKPMRMKIHIYPNGNGNDAIEQGMEAANLLAAGGFGASGFSASNPTSVVAPPPKNSVLGKQSDSAMLSGPTGPHPTSPSGFGGTSLSGPMGGTAPAPKNNKNVVLHLHVHRRNDNGALELETEGSAPIPATAKPLTYKEIFDEQMKKSEQQRNSHLSNHRDAEEEEEETSQSVQDQEDTQETERNENEDSERGERDKSVSMEVPIHDEKIEDVFHSIMKFRKKPDDRKKRS